MNDVDYVKKLIRDIAIGAFILLLITVAYNEIKKQDAREREARIQRMHREKWGPK
jgi:hypothetical protein